MRDYNPPYQWTVIVKNNSGSTQIIEDLGIEILNGQSIDFHEQFTYDEITGSDDLRTLTLAGSAAGLFINDGIEDLGTVEGEKFLVNVNLHYLKSLEASAANFEAHLDGGGSKHDATEIDVEGTSYLFINDGDLESAIQDIDTALQILAVSGSSLDEAYDYGGSGIGREITVDSGPVKLNATSDGYAPLEFTDLNTVPTSGLGVGQVSVVNGMLSIYDNDRGKWLSVQRLFLTFGRRGKTKNQYLSFGGGMLPSNNSGFRLAKNATIVSMAGQLDSTSTSGCTFKIEKNDVVSTIESLVVGVGTNGGSDATNSINTDLNVDDYVQCYLTSLLPEEDPMLIVEIAWRP